MALKVDYVVRETATNLRRNITLTLASILTVAVSLSLVGAALLLARRRRQRHRPLAGRHRVHRLPEPDVHARAAATSIQKALDENPQVDDRRLRRPAGGVRGVQGALRRHARARRQRRRPRSCRRRTGSSPSTRTPTPIASLGEQFENQPGVQRGRRSPTETIKTSQRLSNLVSTVILVGRRHPAAGRDPADPQHHPHGDVRPAPRDRGDEARRRHATGSSASRSCSRAWSPGSSARRSRSASC